MTDAAPWQRLCRLDELSDPGARGFSLQTAQGLLDIFVVRRGNSVYAYQNHCPHTGSPLDWQPDQFLNLERTLIQCATHFALFRIEDGHCVSGPCAGQALTPIPSSVTEDWVCVAAQSVIR